MGRPKAKPARKPTTRAVDYRRLAGRLRLVSDPTRLRLLLVLGEGERSVGDLAAALGSSDASTSHHLAKLRAAGVVEPRKDSQRVYYSLTDAGRELVRAVEGLGGRGAGRTTPAH